MLSKCMNPACAAKFRYLHEGKLFKVQSQPAGPEDIPKVEFFWLCNDCSRKLTLAVCEGEVTTRFLPEELSPASALEKPRPRRSSFFSRSFFKP